RRASANAHRRGHPRPWGPADAHDFDEQDPERFRQGRPVGGSGSLGPGNHALWIGLQVPGCRRIQPDSFGQRGLDEGQPPYGTRRPLLLTARRSTGPSKSSSVPPVLRISASKTPQTHSNLWIRLGEAHGSHIGKLLNKLDLHETQRSESMAFAL